MSYKLTDIEMHFYLNDTYRKLMNEIKELTDTNLPKLQMDNIILNVLAYFVSDTLTTLEYEGRSKGQFLMRFITLLSRLNEDLTIDIDIVPLH